MQSFSSSSCLVRRRCHAVWIFSLLILVAVNFPSNIVFIVVVVAAAEPSSLPLPPVATSASTCMDNAQTRAAMAAKMTTANGFLAALDQSGGSSPGALKAYGVPDDVSSLLLSSILTRWTYTLIHLPPFVFFVWSTHCRTGIRRRRGEHEWPNSWNAHAHCHQPFLYRR